MFEGRQWAAKTGLEPQNKRVASAPTFCQTGGCFVPIYDLHYPTKDHVYVKIEIHMEHGPDKEGRVGGVCVQARVPCC